MADRALGTQRELQGGFRSGDQGGWYEAGDPGTPKRRRAFGIARGYESGVCRQVHLRMRDTPFICRSIQDDSGPRQRRVARACPFHNVQLENPCALNVSLSTWGCAVLGELRLHASLERSHLEYG